MGEQSDNVVAESTETTIKVSFGVKRTVTKLIKPSTEVTAANVDSDEERDIEEQARQAKRRRLEKFENGAAPKNEDEEDKHMIIPLVVEDDWRIAKLIEKQKAGSITEEEIARLAILTDNGSTALQIKTTLKREIIQIGGETIGVAVDADYRSVPIDKFGLAILRGCGWTEGSGIGKQPKVVQLQVNAQRPKGLGLGATPRHPDDKKKAGNTKEDEETSGEVTRNSLVKISSGRYSGKYGTVESRDDDNNSVYVRLALGGECVKVSLFSVQKVSKKEYDRDAKCLNKKEYDTAKTQIDKRRNEMEEAIRKKERREDDDIAVIDSKEGTSRDSTEELWIRSDLVIRFINKDYDRGKLYKQKLKVVDVASRKGISLQDDYGQIYYNLKQSWMETVIPRAEGDRMMVVRGRYSGSPAIMERKDKERNRVAARLLNRDNKIVDLNFDDVCLYKPTHEDDYDM